MSEGKLSSYVDESLTFVDESFKSAYDLFEKVSERAGDLGWVRDDFLPRIKKRESMFPTGLQLEKYGVAIPHTDAECVLKEFVAVIVNDKLVDFSSMVDINEKIPTKLVFVLGLNQPHAQLEMLESLMGMLQNQELLDELIDSKSPKDLIQKIKEKNI